MKVALHLGAHKTASTFLQGVLAKADASGTLPDGVRCVPMDDLRREVTTRVGHGPGLPPERAAQRLARAEAWLMPLLERAGQSRLILSDENLIGTPREIVRTAALYPDPAGRLGALPRLLAGHEVELFLAIRHPGVFARSIYCEYLRAPGKTFHPPAPFAEAWLERMPSWLPLIGAIRDAFPQAPLTVWDFALVRKDPQRILNAIASTPEPVEFDTGGVVRRASLSHAAVLALVETGLREGPAAMTARLRETARAHPLKKGNWTYEMWDKAATQAFHRRLSGDLAQIRQMPGVTLLD
ncbi:hypothetical protein HMH01_11745 [Halovulum dunhuangense]|uniref:Sulfotransferase family protein n=1 Tax=Halovulum dunhuangense TaxID=1505036 RepID=A0A849L3X0_9RHOB|nr:hypothetical protein [Halovulum dunhuangense]NNU81108.1 hypothetical protein [Halovulum dunhuangense]